VAGSEVRVREEGEDGKEELNKVERTRMECWLLEGPYLSEKW
jgi:hypothetical protein